MDLALVVALLVVVVVWWRMAGNTNRPVAAVDAEPPTAISSPAIQDAPAAVGATDTDPPGTNAAVPTSTSEPQFAPMEEFTVANPLNVTHRVQSGETLLGIASVYGVSVDEVKAANNLQNELIRAGDELIIPIPESVVEADAAQVVSSVFKYKVQSGDTVVSIAIRFGTQVESILEANRLSANEFIQPGQMLLVPVEQVPSAVLASSEAARTLDQSSQAAYEAPRLIGPQGEEALPTNEQILFRWISVDLLAPNEWYVLRIWPLDGTLDLPPTIWTKTNSYRLGTEWAPPSGRSARYGWQVTVVRVLADVGDGQDQAASAQRSTYLHGGDLRKLVQR
ncbi:MAG: LysM peptidoglycan-binding domain-containing protein [Caldilineaceae bacterium]